MTMASAYFFNIPGNSTVQISKDELRSLLREIESELHRSKVYRLAVANVQKLLGSSDEQATSLFKAVGREAISLAFKQFAKKHEMVIDTHPKIDDIELSNVDLESSSNSPQNSKIITSSPQLGLVNNTPSSLSSTTKSKPDVVANKTVEDKPKTPNRWFRQHQKLSKSELAAQLAAEQRLESLLQIGQQLKQAREFQGLTLQKLNIYTHISVHQMQAVENADFESLPEDVLIRGFIRVMGNALGLNGTILANTLPIPNQTKSVLPSWYHSQKSSGKLNLEIRPIHLYVGYTALVAGALGGLSFVSQQTNNHTIQNSQVIVPTSSSLCQSTQKTEANFKPGLKSSTTGVCISSDISPPEAL
ncbi:helix-turn-helix domain-containing protein [Anabaena cylindrica UHCC 0172]|uniref:helix-turn-helix domain-containing protein n=1 Tax=Anabaena cylindrica TaxID=1165 RepID=UPI002B1FDFE9|nr:helix-turn-helix domain-containing protein [Anabaena cylindrica]MEA5552091.1 helix-turn-helix domain-containing protein [Anabaena cylindrica UHCC 0172]